MKMVVRMKSNPSDYSLWTCPPLFAQLLWPRKCSYLDSMTSCKFFLTEMMTMFADMEINFFFSSETTRNPSHKLYLAKHQVAIKCRLICEC